MNPKKSEQPASNGIIAGSTARESITIGGVALEKTGEVYATGSESVTITGATPSFVGSNASDTYKGVFIEGRTVTLSPFIMGKYEVTQELYEAVMMNQKVTVGETEYMLDAVPSDYIITKDESVKYHPVQNVTWYDAVYFCNALSEKLGLTKAYTIKITEVDTDGHITDATVEPVSDANGYRLPTEAEWEFAARGGDPNAEAWNYLFSGADTGKVSTAENAAAATYDSHKNTGLDSVGWYFHNSKETTHEVGRKAANALGIYDMSGNVWEWCYDWFGNVTAEEGGETDPTGAASGSDRVVRGGSWGDLAYHASVSYRLDGTPSRRYSSQGFRLCRSAQ